MGMKAMYDLKEMLCEELEKIAKKRELSAGSLETVHKLTDTIKNIDKILMLEEDDEGYSERGRHRDSMGRYSREDGMDHSRGHGGNWNAQGSYDAGHSYDEDGSSHASRGQHYVRGHYSRDDGKDRMMHTFGELMEGANPEQRRIIERAMQELRNA